MKQKPKTKLKNPKDHQAGRVARFRSPAQNICSDLAPGSGSAPRREQVWSDEAQSPRHFPLSQ